MTEMESGHGIFSHGIFLDEKNSISIILCNCFIDF